MRSQFVTINLHASFMQVTTLQSKIYEIRGQKVLLDFDLALLYEVETKVLNQAVKRNIKRFPVDFMFRLTIEESENMRSQFVTAYQNKRNITATPFAFTEQGVAMLSGILNSDVAINVNIAIMRTFVMIRKYALYTRNLMKNYLKWKPNMTKSSVMYMML
ncbi:ORF6N domain-containing protein [Flavobacterium luteum]|uniref:ORF6N domain-containing protein n=1 Tax=Flavobacterium luteum TaxID=2026654 RepID=UPI001CD9940B|nr:ORF6N domain-containing protein [Flavobacterium luteum]